MNISVQVQRQEKTSALAEADRQEGFLLPVEGDRLPILIFGPSINEMRAPPIREGRLLYSVYCFRILISFKVTPKRMFEWLSEHHVSSKAET